MPHANQVPPVRSPGAHAAGRVRIVSDGLVHGTQVLMPDGTPLPNVQAVEILPLTSKGGPVMARVTLSHVGLDVAASSLPAGAGDDGAVPG